ncbi:MAG: ribonuclease [Flammeovirgaceae bacterium]|nr:ribonuclease [Flammeovirgaceae bacterium]|tara:strand:+ start:5200 stop:6522 length:1323 start_codon:yes stop_codon:yes gene_type:complete
MPHKKKKIYVLDTSVILFSHDSIMNFEENDIGIPITVLEELDHLKKGNDTINFEAREFIRMIDELSSDKMLNDWIPLNGKTKGKFKILVNQKTKNNIFNDEINDHKILDSALNLQKEENNKVVTLVSKDINLRLKAKSLNLKAEDYLTGKIKNLNSLDLEGLVIENVKTEVIDKIYENNIIEKESIFPRKKLIDNSYYILKDRKKSALIYFDDDKQTINRVEKTAITGIKPRNAEQAFAIHSLLNDNVSLVSINGVAGTGKTLLALASAISQRRNYKQIFVARPIVPLSNKDIGYLPGDINSKINPYMEPLWDNFKYIQNQYQETSKEFKVLKNMIESEKLIIQPLAYIRGRSFSNIYFIIDEAQNLTPHEIKTIISRAGENTKIVFAGDINQIDTPYLDSQSNGLSYLIDKLKGQKLYSHVTLRKGERSELANLANDLL